MKEYFVLKFMTRRKEGMKPYKVGSTIKLSDNDAGPLLKHGFVKLKPKPKKSTKKDT